MKRAILVGAARPNFMKIAPILRALEDRGVEVILVHTGQHYDDALSGRFFRELQLRSPDYQLEVGSGSHALQTARVMERFEPVVAETSPDSVIVVGDVNSTLGCALVAAKLTVPVAHVEAGLRSHDWSMPEEVNRICTDTLSDWLLTPSEDASRNLIEEGFGAERIFLVGNVMVDTLLANRARVDVPDILKGFGLEPGFALLTLHRPSNVDDAEVLARIISVIEHVQSERTVVFPAHPRTAKNLERFGFQPRLDAMHGLRVLPPVSYFEMIAFLESADVVLTDSGGIQEETTVLGTPCLTRRENTERPITVQSGTNQVVGTEPSTVLEAYERIFSGEFVLRRPDLWDGKAADRIAEVLISTPSPRTSRGGQGSRLSEGTTG